MNLWDALIPLSALVFGVLAALGVDRFDRQRGEAKQWKVLLGGICAAALAGGSAAEFTTSNFGVNAEHHPVLTGALTGAALLGITVLIIDSLIKRVAAQSWHGPLEGTWDFALRRGRRGADDLRKHLRGRACRVDVDTVPKERNTKAAYELARKMSFDLSARVGRASLFAFASDEAELGKWIQELSAAPDTLQRTLERYSRCELSHLGEARSHTGVVREWRDYIWWLLVVDEQGRKLEFSSPLEARSTGYTWSKGTTRRPMHHPPSNGNDERRNARSTLNVGPRSTAA